MWLDLIPLLSKHREKTLCKNWLIQSKDSRNGESKTHSHCLHCLHEVEQSSVFREMHFTFSSFVDSFKTLLTRDSCSFLLGFFSIFRYKFICDRHCRLDVNIPALFPNQFLSEGSYSNCCHLLSLLKQWYIYRWLQHSYIVLLLFNMADVLTQSQK